MFSNISPLLCHGNRSDKLIVYSHDSLRNISVEKHLNHCSEEWKIATSTFPIFSQCKICCLSVSMAANKNVQVTQLLTEHLSKSFCQNISSDKAINSNSIDLLLGKLKQFCFSFPNNKSMEPAIATKLLK